MELHTALEAAQWMGMLALYLCMVKLYVALNALRHGRKAADPPAFEAVQVPGQVSGWPVVAMLDTSCTSCLQVAEHIETRQANVAVVTWEDHSAWRARFPDLTVFEDGTLWSSLPQVTAPALLRVDGSGRISEIELPATLNQAIDTIERWEQTHVVGS